MLKCDIHSSLSYEAPRTLGDWFMFLKQKTEDSSFLKKIFFYYFLMFIYLFLTVLGLPCCMGLSVVLASRTTL